MKQKKILFIALIVVLSTLLGACAPVVSNWAGILVDGERIYLADGIHIYTLNAADGNLVTIPAANPQDDPIPLRFPNQSDANTMTFFAPPALTPDGQMVFPNSSPNQHSFYSINPENGNVNWSFDGSKGTWIAGALATEDGIFAPDGEGVLYALSNSGQVLWSLKASEHGLWSHPVTDGEKIYISTLDHFVLAIEPETGKVIWQAELDNLLMSAPAVGEDGRLYIGSVSGALYALDAEDGKVAWRKELQGGIWGSPVLDGDQLFVGTVDGEAGTFYAVNSADGSIIWSQPETGAIVAGALVLEDQVVYVTEIGLVQSRNKEGGSLWQDTLEGKLYAAPALAGDLVLVAPMQGNFLLAAYNLNGAQQWVFNP